MNALETALFRKLTSPTRTPNKYVKGKGLMIASTALPDPRHWTPDGDVLEEAKFFQVDTNNN